MSSALLASHPLPPGPRSADPVEPNPAPLLGTDLSPAFDHLAVARMVENLAVYLEDPDAPPPQVDAIQSALGHDDFPHPGNVHSSYTRAAL